MSDTVAGVNIETASMYPDGHIELRSISTNPGTKSGSAALSIEPGEYLYDLILKRHGALNPGECHTIYQDYIQGTWVSRPDVPENKTKFQL